jgi:hypothetical protein
MRPPPYPKKIEFTERLFFHYKLDASTYSLFDSSMSTPIAYGPINFVAATIKNLPAKSTIFYFELDNREGWKMKKVYKPSAETAQTADAKNKVEKKKDE